MHWDDELLSPRLHRTERWLLLGVISVMLVGQALLSTAAVGSGANPPAGGTLQQTAPDRGQHPAGGAPAAGTGHPTPHARCAVPSLDCGCDGCRGYFDAHFLAVPEPGAVVPHEPPLVFVQAPAIQPEGVIQAPPYPPPR